MNHEVPASACGHRRWAIAEGYLPASSHGPRPELASHEACCILNTSPQDAEIRIFIYHGDREPTGPYRFRVPAQRTAHLRYNDFADPEPVPVGTPFASLIESTVPVVVQHTRLDSRQAENALMTTMAYPC
ncbi:Chain A, Crystal Structure Of Thermotoga Maritima 1070 [uncultured Stenotrophomonas sp.]|uniref:Chain A, Crystal Structure Of Thermotoga Maritima 1070 n=1 Tax=uncultured Stenotrophomonas sp. TaxID=165438 RepID=A0A1Y5Q5I9_9GAMM|nr:Chain A, Crystal Structure Of Thermotoga Maritima 1070 [uncultured Stenotrophomonas sp.]